MRNPQGYVTLMALVLLSLMAVVMVALGTLFATEVRRTQWAQEEAQLRQMLHAASVAVLVKGDAVGEWVELPADLVTDEGAAVSVQREADSARLLATIDTSGQDRTRGMERSLRLERPADGPDQLRIVAVQSDEGTD